MSIAVTDWNGRVSPVFDVACHVVIEELDTASERARREEPLAGSRGEERIEFLLSLGVTELICGAISRPVRLYGLQRGLVIHPFISGAIDEVLEARRAGGLEEAPFRMPGCGRRRRRRCGRGFSSENQ